MADPVLKFPPEQKGNPASPESRPKLAAEPRRRLMAGMRRYRRFLLLVVLPLVALVGRRDVLSQWRPLRDHRRRLCRRAEGSDHARHLRQDREGRGEGRPAGRSGRRAVRDRSGAVPPRRGAGQGQSRAGQGHLRQSDRRPQDLRPDERTFAAGHRPEAARRRPQVVAGEEQFRLAARPRQCVHRARHRAARSSSCCSRRSRPPRRNCSAIPSCRSRNSRPMPRPRRRSTRPSAISTTP